MSGMAVTKRLNKNLNIYSLNNMANSKPVAIYTTPTCGFCKLTKEFLRGHNVAFTEFDVSTDSAKAQEMVEKTGQMGVPVTMVGEGAKAEYIVGFDQAKLTKTLGL